LPFQRNGKRDYKAELAWEKAEKPNRAKERSQRNAARKLLKDKGVDVEGKDVDHKKPLSKGGTNSISNLRAVAPSKNRSVSRKRDGSLK
jgi:5-methylcytosine-specific restriction endonuclease McrA